MMRNSSNLRVRQSSSQQHVSRHWLILMSVLTASLCPVIAHLQPRHQKLLSFRLIPHHEQLRRRKLEAAAAHPDRRWLGDDIPYGIHRKPQRRRTQGQVLNILYQGYGTHYVDLWCGTPTGQRQTVIVDTGSHYTAFPCLGCEDCGDEVYHIDPLYNQSASTSFHAFTCDECEEGSCFDDETCQLGLSYQEGSSWRAFESSDICYTGGPHDRPLAVSTSAALSTSPPLSSSKDSTDPSIASSFAFPLKFGCQTALTGLFRTQLEAGIMGMNNADAAFWSQMYQAGKIEEKQFSLCFSRQDTVSRNGTQAGAMTLGGLDSRLHTSPVVYTSTTDGFSNRGLYTVHLRRVYLRQGGGGDSAAAPATYNVTAVDVSEETLNEDITFVDSGTTDTYFSNTLSEPFDAVWTELTGEPYSYSPVSLTAEQVNQLPTILFQLQGDEETNGLLLKATTNGVVTGLAGSLDPDHPLDVILAFPPSHYMEYDDRFDMYVPRFYIFDSGRNVIGANAIMGHDVTFDVTNSRIGWAESHCNHTELLESISTAPSPTTTTTTNPKKGKTGKSGNTPTTVTKKQSTRPPTPKLGNKGGKPVTATKTSGKKMPTTKKPVASTTRAPKTGKKPKPVVPKKSSTSNRPHHRLV